MIDFSHNANSRKEWAAIRRGALGKKRKSDKWILREVVMLERSGDRRLMLVKNKISIYREHWIHDDDIRVNEHKMFAEHHVKWENGETALDDD